MYISNFFVIELEAAKKAGWQVVALKRPGNKPLPDGYEKTCHVVETFDALFV
jgi:methionine salvage enolase-phosphatase E1